MSIDRFLPRARRLPLLVPPLPPLPLNSCSLRYSLHWPFRSSLTTILYFALPSSFSLSSSPCPRIYIPRVLWSPLFSSHVLFFTVLFPLSLSLCLSLCDRTTQPNNRHRRLKPENSAASSLLFSRSTRRSSFSIPSRKFLIVLSFTTRILLSIIGTKSSSTSLDNSSRSCIHTLKMYYFPPHNFSLHRSSLK